MNIFRKSDKTGTIDKDYPRSTGGYAFEFGDEPAAGRLLRAANVGSNVHVTYGAVCAKDSTELKDEDRYSDFFYYNG